MSNKACDIIIPVFNKPELIKNCLESIDQFTSSPYTLIIIDNASDSPTREFLEAYKADHRNAILVRNDTNLGWVKAVNQGIRTSSSPYVCVMNNDTLVRTDEWLSKMIDVAELQPDIGLVNPRFDVKLKADPRKPFIEIDFCRGYCILIKRVVIDRIGVLDEAYGLGYYDDDDYSVRAIRAGFRCVRANGVHVEHLRDSTFKAIFKEEKRIELHEKNKALFYSRWGRRLHIVFIITNPEGRDSLKELLFSLARKQHILHVWNTTTPLGVEHTNIREKIFPQFLNMLTLSLGLYRSRMRKESKRYALVFTDDKKLSDILSRTRWNVNFFDSLKGGDHVCRIVDAAAGAEKLEEMKV